jgi:hypothetical protein
MIQLKRALACGVLFLSSSLVAHADTNTNTFAFLTGIQDDGSKISLTGVLVNTTTPTTLALPGDIPDRCANLFLTMLSHPGTYTLTVVTDTEFVPPPPVPPGQTGSTITSFTNCSLNRVSRGDHD